MTLVSRKGRAQGKLVKGSMVPEPSAAREQADLVTGEGPHPSLKAATSYLLVPMWERRDHLSSFFL